MAELKKDFGGISSNRLTVINNLSFAVFCLVAWNAGVANAEQVYNVVLRRSEGFSMLAAGDVSSMHDTLLESTLGNSYTKLYSYSKALNGFSVRMSPEQAATLSQLPEVVQVQEDRIMYASTTHSYEYLQLPQGAWNQAGGTDNAGEDVVIGIVDTGIYPAHPSFSSISTKPYGPLPNFKGNCDVTPDFPLGSCSGKIIAAQHFLKGALATGMGNNTDPAYLSPLDHSGHGTHVSSTAAGAYGVPVEFYGYNYGIASGTAPRARVSVYKCLDAKGSGTSSDIIAAIDQAIADGVHILSLSLGPSMTSVENITFMDNFEIACLGAVRAGVFVTQAAGNTGPEPATITSWSPWIITVAASTTDRSYPSFLVLGNMQNISGTGLAPSTPGPGLYPLVLSTDAHLANLSTNAVLNLDFDCADPSVLDKSVLEGKILVCLWDGIPSISGSVDNATRIAGETVGAVGVVLVYTFSTGGQTTDPPAFRDYPGIVISEQQSVLSFDIYYSSMTLKNAAGQITKFGASGRLSGGENAVYDSAPPSVTSFSARGPDMIIGTANATQLDVPVADIMKPNVMAPGVNIWAAWSPIPGTEDMSSIGQNFSMKSGTSMATPHLAGIAALVKQRNPTWSPAAIASALSTTAKSVDPLGQALLAADYTLDAFGQILAVVNRPGTPFDFGSGFVDATAALNPGLIFDATFNDFVNFLCSMPRITHEKIYAATGQSCPMQAGLPSDLNAPSITIGHLNGSRIVPRTVKNVAGKESYIVSVTAPAGVAVDVKPYQFTIAAGATQLLLVNLTATGGAIFLNQTSFGKMYLKGDLGHVVQVPLTVMYRSLW